jgi:hypothetical protein
MTTDLSEYQIKLHEIYEFEDNIKMYLKERDWKSVECLVTQDRDKLWAVTGTVMNLLALVKRGELLH